MVQQQLYIQKVSDLVSVSQGRAKRDSCLKKPEDPLPVRTDNAELSGSLIWHYRRELSVFTTTPCFYDPLGSLTSVLALLLPFWHTNHSSTMSFGVPALQPMSLLVAFYPVGVMRI